MTFDLDVSYTLVPAWTTLEGDASGIQFSKFSSLSKLAFSRGRHNALESQSFDIAPDERLMCFDTLYPVVEAEAWEWGMDYSPMWNVVGRYLRFSPAVTDVASIYLKRLFGVNEQLNLPPVCHVVPPDSIAMLSCARAPYLVHRFAHPPRRHEDSLSR